MTAFKIGFQQSLKASFLLCCSGLIFNVAAADKAQQLYTSQPRISNAW